MSILGYWKHLLERDGWWFNKRRPDRFDDDAGVYPRPDTTGNPVVGTCPKCGLELRRVMWYYCSQGNCPSGLGSKISL